MQLIGRVFLLALCVFSAYSFPNTINLIHGKVSADDVLHEIENIFAHYRGSNQSNSNNTNNNNTRPPNNNDTIINPPNNNSTRPPNNNDTIINPPNNNSTRPPNNNDTIINPPNNNSTRPPNNNDTVINPPNNNSTRPPNNNDTIINPPNNNNTNNNSTVNLDLCVYKFTNQQNNHNQGTIRSILSCFQLNNQSSILNNTSLNSTVDEVNYSSYRLQFRLSNCAARNSNDDVFNCYVNSFDRNLEDLNDIAEESALAADISAGNYSSLEIAQRACVTSAIIASKSESIRVFNELENCVNSRGN